MSRIMHITDSKIYKHLESVYYKLLVDSDYRVAFHTYLNKLEKDETRIPTTYEALETEYRTFLSDYMKAHRGLPEKSI